MKPRCRSAFSARFAAPLVAAAALAIGAVPTAFAQTPAAGSQIVTIQTAKGSIKIKLFPQEAPKTVANFVKLAKQGFYNGTTFHRVEPGFVIQGGDPLSKKLPVGDPSIGSGGPGYDIKNEANKTLKHNVGAVAMANAGRDTAGSQFYIVITKPAPFLDEKHEDGVNKYTLFGQVISGQNVAEKIAVGDKMIKVTVADAGKGAAAAKPKAGNK
jgi:peptidyl-prolyl cis-trans isomerase B (cyclophilin B)